MQNSTSQEPIRIQKVIALAGIASRRAAEKLILSGAVMLNGVIVKEMGQK
jgi:16S rRNA U516 pseudouridylate synthase RsuA-like enzyme